jgi:hypothetical protein
MCEDPDTGVVGPCDPPVVFDLAVPEDSECSIPYGITLAAFDLPPGHALFPDGGRVLLGFDFNHHRNRPGQNARFLVPLEAMSEGVAFSATQLFFRNFGAPGWLMAADRWDSVCCPMDLPAVFSLPELQAPPEDTGLTVDVTFVAEDPTMRPDDPDFELLRVYAEGTGMNTAGAGGLPMTLTESTLHEEVLKGVVLSRADYVGEDTYLDNWWRIYVPEGTTEIPLPAGVSPFAAGDSVWVTPWGCAFEGPFRYDLFPIEVLLGHKALCSEDSYAAVIAE